MILQTRSLAFESVKAEGDGSTFEGRASVYGVLDSYNEIVAPGAFEKTVGSFLKRGKILSQHRTLIGKPTMCREERTCLMIGGKISDTAEGRDCRTLLKDEVIQSLSIGFRTLASVPLMNPKEVADYWAKIGYSPSPDEVERSKYGARVLTEIDLMEVSLVSFPANTACDITSVKTVADALALARADLLRLKAMPKMSPEHRQTLKGHRDVLMKCVKEMNDILDQTEPEDDPDAEPTEGAEDLDKAQTIALRARLALYAP